MKKKRNYYTPGMLGKKHSKETKLKMVFSHKGKRPSSEVRNKMRLARLGKKLSEETKKKISEFTKKRWEKIKLGLGKDNFHTEKWYKSNIGKVRSEEFKEKASERKKGKPNWYQIKGVNHPSWRGGISKDPNYRKNKTKEWKIKNYDRVLFLNNRRRILRKNAEGSHTFGDWENLKAQYNFTCPYCKVGEPEIKLTEDHIIPLSMGGSDNIENIQPLCKSCNFRKHTKVIKYA